MGERGGAAAWGRRTQFSHRLGDHAARFGAMRSKMRSIAGQSIAAQANPHGRHVGLAGSAPRPHPRAVSGAYARGGVTMADGSMAMWSWSLNWAEVTDLVLVGTCPMRPADLERIRAETDAAALLSVQHDECLAYWGIDEPLMREAGARLGLRMERRAMRDFDIADQQRRLASAVAALAELQASGVRTYVHCTAGLGRAPLTVLSYLVWIEGYSPEAAIALIKAARPGAVPAWEAHRGAWADLVERHRPAIAARAYRLSEMRSRGEGSAEADWSQAEREVIREWLAGRMRATSSRP